MIDFEMVEKLLALLADSQANTIEVKKGWWSTTVKVSKGPMGGASGPVTYQVAAESNPDSPASPASPAAASGEESVEAPAHNHIEIKSPMVGTFTAGRSRVLSHMCEPEAESRRARHCASSKR